MTQPAKSTENGRSLRLLAGLLLVAAILRLGVAFTWQHHLDAQGRQFGFGDSESYWALAETIARAEPYQFGSADARVFRTPGYPLLLAPLFLLGDGPPPVIWARIQSALFGTMGVAGVWLLACLLYDRRTALLAAAMAAFYPGTLALSVLVLAEAPFLAILPWNLAVWAMAYRARTHGRAAALGVAAGALAGMATLIRPSWLLFTPFVVAVGLGAAIVAQGRRSQRDWSSPRRQAIVGVGLFVGLVLTMSPWWIRNARVTGHFVPTSLQVGASLYDGLNPAATGGSDMWFTPEMIQAEREAQLSGQADGGETFEYRLDRRHHAAAVAWAQANPRRVAQLAGLKFLRMWNIWPNERAFSAWPLRLIVAGAYVPIMLLALAGVWTTGRLDWPYRLCWLPAVYFTLLHVVFVASMRYRDPAMLGLMVLAAGTLTSWRERRRGVAQASSL